MVWIIFDAKIQTTNNVLPVNLFTLVFTTKVNMDYPKTKKCISIFGAFERMELISKWQMWQISFNVL